MTRPRIRVALWQVMIAVAAMSLPLAVANTLDMGLIPALVWGATAMAGAFIILWRLQHSHWKARNELLGARLNPRIERIIDMQNFLLIYLFLLFFSPVLILLALIIIVLFIYSLTIQP
jgi:hypothetical protein